MIPNDCRLVNLFLVQLMTLQVMKEKREDRGVRSRRSTCKTRQCNGFRIRGHPIIFLSRGMIIGCPGIRKYTQEIIIKRGVKD
jgi:hypothetical protein